GSGAAGTNSQASGVQEYGAGAGTAAGAGGGAGRTAATGGGGGGVSATGGDGDCGGAATWLGGGGQAQEAVAISKAETIRVRTQSPLSALSRFAAGAEVSASAASCPAEEVVGPSPVILGARHPLHQFGGCDAGQIRRL